MDQADITLCTLLQADSRAPYHELAGKLGLSINAVHKRVRGLVESGIIRSFRARVSLSALDTVNVWVFGKSDSPHLEDMHLQLRENDSTYWVAYSGGGLLYVGGYLQDLSRLGQFTSFVASKAKMTDPTVGILPSMPRRSPQPVLHPLDYRIISSLQHDSRKPLSDVALESGASAKTVRRRLSWMADRQLIDLTIDWYPDASNDIIAISHIGTAAADKTRLASSVTEAFNPNVMFCMSFSNLPNQLVAFLWTNTMRQMEGLKHRLSGVKGGESIALNVLQIGFIFDTWRDRVPSERLAAIRPGPLGLRVRRASTGRAAIGPLDG